MHYTEHPYLYGIATSEPLTGSPDTFWLDVFGERYLGKHLRMVSIGCGLAVWEEYLLEHGFIGHVVGFEPSKGAAAAVAERIAGKPHAANLELRSDDILSADLEDESFDVVFVLAAIHHFIEIEAMFRLMHRILKPGGLIIYDEYVGPDHHIHPPELLAVMDRVNACLPPSLRRDYLTEGKVREQVHRPSLEWTLATDPTEGVHATRILPLTYQYFDIVQRIDYGGTIIRWFLTGILLNFDFSSETDQTIARLLVLLERELTRSGTIPHHNVNVVARKREVPRPPLTEAEAARIAYSGWEPPSDRHSSAATAA